MLYWYYNQVGGVISMEFVYSIEDQKELVEYISKNTLVFRGVDFHRFTYLCDDVTGKHVVEHEALHTQLLVKTDFKTKQEALEFIFSHIGEVLQNKDGLTIADILAKGENVCIYDLGAKDSLSSRIQELRYPVGKGAFDVKTQWLGTSRTQPVTTSPNYTVNGGGNFELSSIMSGVPDLGVGNLSGVDYSEIEVRLMCELAQQIKSEKKTKK